MAIRIVDESFDRALFAGSSCAFGVFDGLHVGHRYLIDQAVGTRETGGRAIAVTFDIDPDEVFHPDRLKKLSRNGDRLEALSASGVDEVVVFPFVEPLYSKSPEEFLAHAFSGGVPAHMHVGDDFRFGARAAGTVATLEEWGNRLGCQIHAHALVSADGKPITATRIRKLLMACELDEAERLLGHRYALRETVQPGRGDGANFGFATANLQVKPHDRVLGEGVYAAYVTVCGNGKAPESAEAGVAAASPRRYKAAVSVGVSPTFEATSVADMEVHILDFEGDLIGRDIRVEFVEYLRPMIKFDSTEELIACVMGNIAYVRENL